MEQSMWMNETMKRKKIKKKTIKWWKNENKKWMKQWQNAWMKQSYE